MAKTNNITKAEALEYTHRVGNMDYAIECIVKATFYGMDYTGMFEDTHAMSKLCRAFNITEYGSSSNRIKNRYKKYAKVEGAENYLRQILRSAAPGFKSEQPRVDDLLAMYPEVNVFDKKQPMPASKPQTEYVTSTPKNSAQFPVEVIPIIAIIIAAVLLLKWNPVLVILLAIIGGVVYYQIKKGNRLRKSGQASSTRKIVLGVLGIFFAFLVIVGIKGAMVDDSESLIMVIVYGIIAALCFRGALK